MNSDTKRKKGLKQQIYTDIKDKLINCIYPPGSELNELVLANEHKVSRTPIREAISQLELDGYLKVLPKKGIYISDISVDDALEIFQTRIEIEPIVIKLAYPYLNIGELIDFRHRFEAKSTDLGEASRLDTDMHIYLIDNCRNSYIINMMHKLFDDNTRIVIATGQNKTKIHNAQKEHLAVLDSLIAHKEPDECADLMRRHIQSCRAAALKYFSSEEYLSKRRNENLSSSLRK